MPNPSSLILSILVAAAIVLLAARLAGLLE